MSFRRTARDECAIHASGVHINFPTTEGAAGGLLQGLFDLSPAEARVARGIAERQTLEAIADDLGISRETVALSAQIRAGQNRHQAAIGPRCSARPDPRSESHRCSFRSR
jgi:hypothetical protein